MKRLLMTTAVVGLLVGARAPVAWAHEGHAHKTMGTVTMVHENHVEVKDAKGKLTTFALSDKTKITRGGAVMKMADIKVGDRVVVTSIETKGKDGKTTVNVSAVQLGTVKTAAKR